MIIVEKISEVLKRHRNILFAYVYGSFARKEARKDSDIDVAIFLKNSHTIEKDPMFEVKLALEIEKELRKPVDVRILNDKPLIFINQVMKHGKLLFSRDERERISFETKMLDLYLDFEYLMEEYNKRRFERYGIR
jgi:predicted nucleotidyltransferase